MIYRVKIIKVLPRKSTVAKMPTKKFAYISCYAKYTALSPNGVHRCTSLHKRVKRKRKKKNCPRRRPLIGFLFAFSDSKDSDICFPTSGSARDGLQSIITDLDIHPHLHNGRSKKRLSYVY